MRVWSLLWVAVFCLFVPGYIPFSRAQQTEQKGASPSVPTVSLANANGTPGSTIVVPVYFSPAGPAVGELQAKITFISKNLKYFSFTKGLAAEWGGVDVKAEPKKGKNAKGLETTTLTITASVASAKPGGKGIAAGLLGYITLKASHTSNSADLTLRTVAQAKELGTGKLLPKLKTVNAQVQILANGAVPVFSCFFFTH